jgi:hypothetical protein
MLTDAYFDDLATTVWNERSVSVSYTDIPNEPAEPSESLRANTVSDFNRSVSAGRANTSTEK